MPQRLQRLFQSGQRLAVGGPRLRLGGTLSEIPGGLVPNLATSEVIGDQLYHIVDAPRVQLFETDAGRCVIRPAATLEHTCIHDVLCESVLEAVQQLGLMCRRKDEVEAMEIPQMP